MANKLEEKIIKLLELSKKKYLQRGGYCCGGKSPGINGKI